MSRLKEKYQKEIIAKLQKEFGMKSPMAVPRINKIVINIGIGEIHKDKAAIEKAVNYLTALSGQRPAIRKAKKSIAEFKTRIGSPIGLMVTLRGDRAYDFMDRLVNLVLPKVRDFRGVKSTGFDGNGNYTLGLTEQVIFPEVDYDKIDKIRGLEITIVTNSGNDQLSKRLLEELGMPFEKNKDK